MSDVSWLIGLFAGLSGLEIWKEHDAVTCSQKVSDKCLFLSLDLDDCVGKVLVHREKEGAVV